MILKKIDLNDLAKVKKELDIFIWNFKLGANTMYNFRILKALYACRSAHSENDLLNKPITVSVVSIIEAILIDFLARLHEGASHLPASLDGQTIRDIKAEINKKRIRTRVNGASGETIFLRRKKYQLSGIKKDN